MLLRALPSNVRASLRGTGGSLASTTAAGSTVIGSSSGAGEDEGVSTSGSGCAGVGAGGGAGGGGGRVGSGARSSRSPSLRAISAVIRARKRCSFGDSGVLIGVLTIGEGWQSLIASRSVPLPWRTARTYVALTADQSNQNIYRHDVRHRVPQCNPPPFTNNITA